MAGNEGLEERLSQTSLVDDSTKRSIGVIEPEKEVRIQAKSVQRRSPAFESTLQDGPIEYKRQVNTHNPGRMRSLATQMSYRMDQGHGNCMYHVGVEDDGCHSLLGYTSVAASVETLEYLARSLNAIVTRRVMMQQEIVQDADDVRLAEPNQVVQIEQAPVLPGPSGNVEFEEKPGLIKDDTTITRCQLYIHRIETHLLDPSPKSLEELTQYGDEPLRRPRSTSIGETLGTRNIRVAVVGNVDAGKSTLIGTLTTSSLDDGRGKSRTSIMKHRHEIESGRTSTATTHLMGFKDTGEPIMGRDAVRAHKRKSEDEVARESYRVITLMDLAGHEKYLKTT